MVINTKTKDVSTYGNTSGVKHFEYSYNLGNTSIEEAVSRILEMGYVEK